MVLGDNLRVKALVGVGQPGGGRARGGRVQFRRPVVPARQLAAGLRDHRSTFWHARTVPAQADGTPRVASVACMHVGGGCTYARHMQGRKPNCEGCANAGRPRFPVAAAAASDNLAFELAGWRTTTGLLLHRPLTATLHFTPSIAECAPASRAECHASRPER